MAEHKRRRTDEADTVRERNVVRDGGIARSDAEMEDVTRDTYSTPIGAGRDADHEATDEERRRAGEVLGIARDVAPDPEFPRGSEPTRRRRSDDLAEDGPDTDTTGSSYQGPDGLKVRG